MIYAEEIERAVLGACLLERTAQSTALKSLRAEMFYITAHRAVFEAISALYARGAAVDMLTVCEELRASGRLDEAGGPFAVAKLAGEVATSAHLEYHCTILFQYFLRRRLVEVLTRELAAANDMTCDVYDVLIGTQRELGALLDDSPLENHLHPMPEVMEDTVALVDRRQELSVNGLTGVPTGLQRLNEMTGGWQPGNLIFTAARPADGKTALDLFFARQAAMAGVPVVFFTLEMTASELGERMVLAESRADPLRIRQGKLTAEEVEDVHRTAERMSALPVHVDDTPYINVDQLCVIAKSLRAKGELGLLIVDYLQLLATVNPGRTREQEVAECSRKLKGLARSLGCPVIVSSQLNRQAEDRAGSPELRHLRESGAIEQDADLVILLHRPERYHIRVDPDTGCSTKGMGIATLAKHRNGATGKVYYGYNPSMTNIGIVNGPFSTGAPISVFHFTFHIESGTQQFQLVGTVSLQADTHRHTLFHLHEVTRSIVLRDEGESRSGSVGNRFHHTRVGHTRHGIGGKRYLVALLDVGKLRFTIVGNHPQIAAVYDVHHGLSRLHQLTFVDVFSSRHAVAGSHDDRIA